jgi:hypothetical protein
LGVTKTRKIKKVTTSPNEQKIKPIESISIFSVHFTLNLPQASQLLLMNNRLGDSSGGKVTCWLCDKSLACTPALPPGRVPHVRGLSRTWVEKDGRPGFPVRCTGHDRVCGFQQGKPHEVRQRHQTSQEIRGKPLLFLFL